MVVVDVAGVAWTARTDHVTIANYDTLTVAVGVDVGMQVELCAAHVSIHHVAEYMVAILCISRNTTADASTANGDAADLVVGEQGEMYA